jgi:uncharacterized membrane protein
VKRTVDTKEVSNVECPNTHTPEFYLSLSYRIARSADRACGGSRRHRLVSGTLLGLAGVGRSRAHEGDDTTYVTTFQSFNERIENPWSFSVFFGAPVLIAAALAMYRRSAKPVLALLGAALFLNLVTLAITMAGNVPLNNELADYKSITPEIAATARSDFEDTWNWLNLARTLTSVASLACLTAAMVVTLGSTANGNPKAYNPADVG